MLVEGAIADWSAIYLRTSLLTGPGLAALGYAISLGSLDAATSYVTGLFWPRQGLHSSCCSAMPVGHWWDLRAGAGLATIIPNTFAAAGNIEGSAPGPSLAVVTTAGYVGFLAGPPLIGFVAQLSTIRAALWILVVLSGLSAFASTSMKTTSPLRRIP
jgi:hypothetical protein